MAADARPMAAETEAGAVGPQIRALRKAKGRTLADVAQAAGCSIGHLSQIERGLSDPTLALLTRLARALGVPLSWFFSDGADAPAGERDHVVRRGARRRLELRDWGFTEDLLSPGLGGRLALYLSTFAPGAARGEMTRRACAEAGLVLTGRLELWVGDRHFVLEEGDAFSFDDEPHRWRNPGDDPCVVVWALSPPAY